MGSPVGLWVSWSLTSPKPLGASPSPASMMVPALSLLGTMGTLLGGVHLARPLGMWAGGLHPQERRMRSAGTNATLPSPPFLRQGSQAWDTYRDSAMMWDLRTCSQPQGSFQVWEQQQNCSSASPQGALAGHVLRMDGSREELALHSSGRFSVQVSGSTHMSQVPCPGCHTSQPHRAPWPALLLHGAREGVQVTNSTTHSAPSPQPRWV